METRNYLSGASAAPPSPPGTPSVGYPTNGNPSTGTPATVPGDFWFYKVGEELRNVIAQVGLTPSDSNLGQLWEAVNPGASLGAAGWIKLPAGLMLQWGNFTSSAGGNVTVTLPVSFPVAHDRTYLSAAGPYVAGIVTGSVTASNFQIEGYDLSGTRAAFGGGYLSLGRWK